jgi:hypothetical protein
MLKVCPLEFDLTFSVLFDGAADDVEISATATYKDFVGSVADTMGIPRKNIDALKLAYKFSTAPQKEPFQYVSTPRHLSRLFDDAAEAIASLESSRSTKKKHFVVFIKNLAEEKKNKKPASSKKKKKKVCAPSDIGHSLMFICRGVRIILRTVRARTKRNQQSNLCLNTRRFSVTSTAA